MEEIDEINEMSLDSEENLGEIDPEDLCPEEVFLDENLPEEIARGQILIQIATTKK
jgi:hypothetical protein